MADARRSTIYLDSDLHRALRLKSIEADRSVSDLVNEAVRQSMAEDAADLAAFEERANEATIPYGDFLKQLKSSGKL